MVNWQELPKLSEDELEMCRKAFQLFDKDGKLFMHFNVRTANVNQALENFSQGVVQLM
jgi:Ca2+-binding EF-hand superfamily protein